MLKYRPLLLFLLLATGVTLVLALPTRDYLLIWLERARAAGSWGPLWVLLLYIPATVLLVPGSILTLAAGYLFGVWRGGLAVWTGANLGALAAFMLGRTLARSWVEQRFAGNARFQALDQAISQQGFRMVLMVRLSPLFPFTLLNYGLGLTSVRIRDYAAASALGMIPGTLLYVYVGAAASSLADLAAGQLEWGTASTVVFVLGLLATLLLTIQLTRAARRALREANVQ